MQNNPLLSDTINRINKMQSRQIIVWLKSFLQEKNLQSYANSNAKIHAEAWRSIFGDTVFNILRSKGVLLPVDGNWNTLHVAKL